MGKKSFRGSQYTVSHVLHLSTDEKIADLAITKATLMGHAPRYSGDEGPHAAYTCNDVSTPSVYNGQYGRWSSPARAAIAFCLTEEIPLE